MHACRYHLLFFPPQKHAYKQHKQYCSKNARKKKLHIKKTLKFAPKKATFLNELLMLLSQRWLKTSKKRL